MRKPLLFVILFYPSIVGVTAAALCAFFRNAFIGAFVFWGFVGLNFLWCRFLDRRKVLEKLEAKWGVTLPRPVGPDRGVDPPT